MNCKQLLGFALIAIFLSASAVCRSQAVPFKPQTPAADEKAFDYRRTTLDNGMNVISLEDFSSPIVAVQVWYAVGSKDEQPDRQGYAHMFEHMMFKGTDRVVPDDHFNFIRP